MKKSLNVRTMSGSKIRKFFRIMRLLIVILTISFSHLSASLYSQTERISLDLNNVNIQTVFNSIEEKTEYLFVYSMDAVNNFGKLSIKAENEKVSKILDKCLMGSAYTYEVKDNIIVVKPETLKNEKADKLEIKGNVVSEDGDPLPGVSVVVKGSVSGTATDINGHFNIKVEKGDILVFSFIGMQKQEVKISGSKDLKIILKKIQQQIDEVMVVAYGTSKKSSFTGAAVQVNQSKLEKRPVTNIVQALDGASAGIQLSSGNGQPGSSPTIRIRGFGSINASNEPLIVLDGIPYDGSLSEINSEDIASISVLKDAASSALYGSKAANGVVIITTKKGNKTKTDFSVKAKMGIAQRAVPEYERVNAYDYYPLMWEAYRNSMHYSQGKPLDEANRIASGLVEGEDGIFDLLGYNPFNVANNQIVGTDGKLNPKAKLLYPDDLDWYDEVERIGKRQDFNVNGSGGNEKTKYYMSLGYTKEEGCVIESDFERITARVNADTKVNTWLTAGINLAETIVKSNQIVADSDNNTGYANVFYFARNIGPIYPIHQHDPLTGEYILDEVGKKIYDYGKDRGEGASPGRHVVAEKLLDQEKNTKNVLNMNFYFELELMKDLKFKVNNSLNHNNYRSSTYDNPRVGDGSPSGRGEAVSYERRVYNFNQLLTYSRNIDLHNFDILLGHESYDYKYKRMRGYRSGVIVEGNPELINFTKTEDLYTYTNRYRTEGYLSRINYNYDEKYFFSASYRKDGSSKFHKDCRWGDFWSIGGAYRLDKESFFKDLPYITMLKLRASYGEVGNDSGINIYAWQPLYEGDMNNNYEAGFYQESLGNPGLLWESNNSFDVALEFGLFDNRLSGCIEYFYRESDNLLFSVPMPVSSGIESQDQNIGSMFNKGVELSISGNIISLNDFNWTLNLNATTYKNEITELPQKEIKSGTKKMMKGKSRYEFWLRDWYGVNPDNGDALYTFDDANEWDDKTCLIKDEIKLTTDPNKALYKYHGSSIPDVYGSITNKITYKNIDLSFLVNYKLGGKVYDYSGYGSGMHSGDYGSSWNKDIKERWQKPGDKTNVPRLDNSQNSKYGAGSDRWLVDGSYLSLKNVTLSYQMPKSVTRALKISNMDIYFAGENLWLKSKRKGLDPQQTHSGVIYNSYVPLKILTLGVNIKL